jgi:hypothetical protein
MGRNAHLRNDAKPAQPAPGLWKKATRNSSYRTRYGTIYA